MRVVLIRTEGRGGSAEIEIDGEPYVVVDSISPVGDPTAPGLVERPRLEVITIEHLSGPAQEGEQPTPALIPERGWRYRGCGEVIASDPLRVALGPFSLEPHLESAAELPIGSSFNIAIDRIILSQEPG